MRLSSLAALLVVALTAPLAHGQAKLLPPVEKHGEEISRVEFVPTGAILSPQPETSGINQLPNNGDATGPQLSPNLIPNRATIGPPTSLPTLSASQSEVPANGPPHQMYGREPAHGTKTAGMPIAPPTMPMLQAQPIPIAELRGPRGKFWGEVDILVWWLQGDRPPALLTTSPNGTPQNQAGVLFAPGTTTLAGNKGFNDEGQAGVRFVGGYWFDPLQTFGIQVGGFRLANNSKTSTFVSSGDPILARPFFDAVALAQSAELVAYPGFSSGSVIISGKSSFNGWDIALRENAWCGRNGRIDGILGYRQLRLADQLGITEDLTASTTPGPRGVPSGTRLLIVDRFDTENEFFGAEFGIVGELRYRQWVFEGLAKLAAGYNVSHVNINGATFVNPPVAPLGGGLLALPTNIGLVRHTDPALIPEFGLNVAYDYSDHLRLRSGYSFLYWDQVHRPGQQIDTTINPNLLPPGVGGGPARPQALRAETDLFLHGLNFGVEVRY